MGAVSGWVFLWEPRSWGLFTWPVMSEDPRDLQLISTNKADIKVESVRHHKSRVPMTLDGLYHSAFFQQSTARSIKVLLEPIKATISTPKPGPAAANRIQGEISYMSSTSVVNHYRNARQTFAFGFASSPAEVDITG
ncbi:hypothetical protein V8C44DRAFT_130089 [Trichoderma aethiopicum]